MRAQQTQEFCSLNTPGRPYPRHQQPAPNPSPCPSQAQQPLAQGTSAPFPGSPTLPLLDLPVLDVDDAAAAARAAPAAAAVVHHHHRPVAGPHLQSTTRWARNGCATSRRSFVSSRCGSASRTARTLLVCLLKARHSARQEHCRQVTRHAMPRESWLHRATTRQTGTVCTRCAPPPASTMLCPVPAVPPSPHLRLRASPPERAAI